MKYRRLYGKIATKLFHDDTIFNFHMNNIGMIIESKAGIFIIKNKAIIDLKITVNELSKLLIFEVLI